MVSVPLDTKEESAASSLAMLHLNRVVAQPEIF